MLLDDMPPIILSRFRLLPTNPRPAPYTVREELVSSLAYDDPARPLLTGQDTCGVESGQ